MGKFKIKETYLLLLIVLGLVSLGVYTTYALFTASTTINDVVGITATLDIGKSLTEYEVITVQPNETKLIELNVVNSYNGNIYYGAWYQIVKGNSSDIDIGLYTENLMHIYEENRIEVELLMEEISKDKSLLDKIKNHHSNKLLFRYNNKDFNKLLNLI